MKRREFLIKSAAIGGGMAAPSVLGTPCPPPTFAMDDELSVDTACVGPEWFRNMPSKTWATPVINTLDDVKPDPVPSGNTGHRAICEAWTGGAVDQANGRLILAANGGHLDYRE